MRDSGPRFLTSSTPLTCLPLNSRRGI